MPPFNQPARFWSSITTASSSYSRLPLSLLVSRNDNHPSPFFRPNSDLREGHDDGTRPDRSGEGRKGKRPIRQGDEELVDDQEWSLRVGKFRTLRLPALTCTKTDQANDTILTCDRLGDSPSTHHSTSSVRPVPTEGDVSPDRV